MFIKKRKLISEQERSDMILYWFVEVYNSRKHVKLITAVFVVMFLVECDNLTMKHIYENCYFFDIWEGVNMGTYVIGISGTSGSGKSTFSGNLQDCLSDYKTIVIHMDEYYKEESKDFC